MYVYIMDEDESENEQAFIGIDCYNKKQKKNKIDEK